MVFGGIALTVAWGLGSILRARAWVKTRDAGRRRRLDRVQTVRIADVKPGAVVKIVGKVEPIARDGAGDADAALLEAPLTGQRAIAFVTGVDILDKSSKYSPPSVTPYRCEKRAQDFWVRDESGVALVRVDRADVVAEPLSVADTDGRQQRWLRRVHGRARFLLVVPRKLQFSETALRPGAEVVVMGRCVAVPTAAAEGPYREGGEPLITLEAASSGALVLSWNERA